MASNTTLNAKTVNSHSTNAGTLRDKHSIVSVSNSDAAQTINLNLGDSGKVFIIDAAAASKVVTFNLPAVASSNGFNAKFIMKTAAQSNIVWTSDGDNMIVGCTDFSSGGTDQIATNNTFTTMTYTETNGTGSNGVVGDRFELFCNGTNYLGIGFSNSQLSSGSTVWVGS